MKKPSEEIKKLKPTIPRPDVNLDLISKLYKNQVAKDGPALGSFNIPKPGFGTILSAGVGGAPASPGSQSTGSAAMAGAIKPPGAVNTSAAQAKPVGR